MNSPIPEILLSDGLALPAIGLGTYLLNGAEGIKAMVGGIHLGYRLLDSAFNYENEGAVGQAVKRSGVPREKLLVTSKLPGRHHAYKEAVNTIQESLYRAGLDYYDLYLIHWPNPGRNLYVEAWQALLDAQKWGLIRSVGVCNFLPEHIERLVKETGIGPSVNQIELHPSFSQKGQLAWHKAHGVVTEAWSPLGRQNAGVMQNPGVVEIARRHGRSVTQVVLRWHVQRGVLPIPKSSSLKRQAENLAIFDFALSEEEMGVIGALTHPGGRIRNQDPAVYEEF
ncbi:MAG: aldo/keto reductase [Oscillospiraceae bacterium]